MDDDRTIPDTTLGDLRARLGDAHEFALFEANGQPVLGRGAEVELRGTLGHALRRHERGYEIVPERGGQFQDPKPRRKPEVVKAAPTATSTSRPPATSSTASSSRKRPNADVEEGHRSTTFAHLANIALATRKRLDWDAAGRAIHQLQRGQRACCTTSIASRGRWGEC